jgi:hypothetical protein
LKKKKEKKKKKKHHFDKSFWIQLSLIVSNFVFYCVHEVVGFLLNKIRLRVCFWCMWPSSSLFNGAHGIQFFRCQPRLRCRWTPTFLLEGKEWGK